MKYFRIIWQEMKEQPVLVWVTVGGTALSIFLVMVVYMIGRLDTVPVYPENNRERVLISNGIELRMEDGSSSGAMSDEMARRFYDGLPGVAVTSYMNQWTDPVVARYGNAGERSLVSRKVDENFWKVYGFKFAEGEPFNNTRSEQALNHVVLTDEAAGMLGIPENSVGKEVVIDNIPYTIRGIVKSGSSMMKMSFAEVYLPYNPQPEDVWQDYMGQTGVALLLEDADGVADVKKEVDRRYQVFNSTIKNENREIVNHQNPLTSEELASDPGTNTDPDTAHGKKIRCIIYALLLLLPAINLSGLTRSRLARRVAEIGIRRSFGATKTRVCSELLGENMMLTLAGGLVGLALSVIFMMFFSGFFVNYLDWDSGKSDYILSAMPAVGMLFTWDAFFIALLFCFILNLLSAGIPAWKAARINPAEAISSH